MMQLERLKKDGGDEDEDGSGSIPGTPATSNGNNDVNDEEVLGSIPGAEDDEEQGKITDMSFNSSSSASALMPIDTSRSIKIGENENKDDDGDDDDLLSPTGSAAAPGPRLRIVNGEIQIDYDSLMVNDEEDGGEGGSVAGGGGSVNGFLEFNGEVGPDGMPVLEERAERHITSATFRRRSFRMKWSSELTDLFFKVNGWM